MTVLKNASLVVTYLYDVINILEKATDLVVFGLIATALIFGVFYAASCWAKDSALRVVKIL